MPRHRASVLVDTNTVIEAHRTGSWRALTGGYRVETVEDCVTETQTGYQRRRPEQRIDLVELRQRLAAVHSVEDLQRARLAIAAAGIALDVGEAALWAHTVSRNDDWVLCGPDRASLRCGVRLGFRERLVALEGLLDAIGCRPRGDLREAYRTRWHRQRVADLLLAERNWSG